MSTLSLPLESELNELNEAELVEARQYINKRLAVLTARPQVRMWSVEQDFANIGYFREEDFDLAMEALKLELDRLALVSGKHQHEVLLRYPSVDEDQVPKVLAYWREDVKQSGDWSCPMSLADLVEASPLCLRWRSAGSSLDSKMVGLLNPEQNQVSLVGARADGWDYFGHVPVNLTKIVSGALDGADGVPQNSKLLMGRIEVEQNLIPWQPREMF